MSELKLFVWRNDPDLLSSEGDFECVLCGLVSSHTQVAAMLLELEAGKLPRKRGDLCLSCLAAGKEEAEARARDRARYLRSADAQRMLKVGKPQLNLRASRLEEMAAEVESIRDWATAQTLAQAKSLLAVLETRLE